MKKSTFWMTSVIIMLFLILSSCEKKNHPPVIDDQTFTIDENSLQGTLVGQIASGGQTLKYSIRGGNTGDAFEISETEGNITVKNTDVLDFETTPSYTLNIEITDVNNEKGKATITVNLNNLEIPTTGLQLYMPFNGNLNDLSTNNNTAVDHTSHNYVAGKRSEALDFNGSSDYIQLTQTINSQLGLSFVFWVYTRGANGSENNGSIISKYSKINNTRCFMVYSFGSYETRSDNRLGAAFYEYGSSSAYHDMTKSYLEPADISMYPNPELWTLLNPTRLVTGEWSHCVVNLTPTTIEIWINGSICTKKTRQYTSYSTSTIEPVLIGNNYDIGEGINNHFNGKLDELRVYNRGFTADEIRILFKE